MSNIQTTITPVTGPSVLGGDIISVKGDCNTPFKPSLMWVDKSEIEGMRQRLKRLITNPRPSDRALDEEAELTAQLVGNAVLWTDEWAKQVNPDHVLLGEIHTVTAHNLVQSLLALHQDEDLGIEAPSNFLLLQFDLWAFVEKRKDVKQTDYSFYQKALVKTGLNDHDVSLASNYMLFSPLSNQWAFYAVKQNELLTMLNDHDENVYGDLMDQRRLLNIKSTFQEGMKRRNQYMVEKMGALQQVGLNHVAGEKGVFHYEKSMMFMALAAGKKTIAPIFDQDHFENDMPDEAKSLPSIRPHFLPGREFNRKVRGYCPTLEREYLQATLSHFGYDGAQFKEFLTAQHAAEEKMAAAFEHVYQKHPPTLWRRLVGGLYPAWR